MFWTDGTLVKQRIIKNGFSVNYYVMVVLDNFLWFVVLATYHLALLWISTLSCMLAEYAG